MTQGLNKQLRYKSPLHEKLKKALESRKKFSADKMADRHERWTKDEEQAKAYMTVKEADRLRTEQTANGSPQYATIQIPYSYGLLMAAHTWWSSVFLARSPVLQYDVRHGIGAGGSQAVEALMNYQATVGGMMVPWYHWLLDTPKYGVGWVGHHWDSQVITTSRYIEEEELFAGFPTGKTRKVKRTVHVPGYQGNRVFNVRPQDMYPDPRVSLCNFQKGEFLGRYLEISWLELHEGAVTGKYMNVDVLKNMFKDGKWVDPDRDTGSSNFPIPEVEERSDENLGIPHTGFVEGYEMFVRLIPSHWGLGKGTRREMWVFTIAKGCVIIEARPLGALHDEFPFDNMEYEIDAHTMFKRSMMETLQPLNDTLTWLFNSHFYAVRKSLNNQFIYDPLKVRGSDFTDPVEGQLIRLKPDAYGTPINQVVQQLQVYDLTKNHINDSRTVMEMMQRVSGVNDMIMGMMSQGGRQTATEVRGAGGGSANRLKTQAEFMSAQGFAPHSIKLLQNTQQFLDVERMYRIAGDLLPGGKQELLVGPEQIAGFYDFVPVDGAMPMDKFAQANLWKELLMGVAGNEQLSSQYDIGKIFAYTAQLAGAKNIQRFKVQLVQDDMMHNAVHAGNVIPLGGGRNALDRAGSAGNSGVSQGGGVPSGDEGSNPRLVEPRQLSGVGPLS